MMPDGAAIACVERKSIVSGGCKHDAADNHRCNFQAIRVCRVKDPFSTQLDNVVYVDLRQSAVAASGVVAVVCQPICVKGSGLQFGGSDIDEDGGPPIFLGSNKTIRNTR